METTRVRRRWDLGQRSSSRRDGHAARRFRAWPLASAHRWFHRCRKIRPHTARCTRTTSDDDGIVRRRANRNCLWWCTLPFDSLRSLRAFSLHWLAMSEPSACHKQGEGESNGGEGGIRTHLDSMDSVSCRFYTATIAVNASDAVAPCPLLPAGPWRGSSCQSCPTALSSGRRPGRTLGAQRWRPKYSQARAAAAEENRVLRPGRNRPETACATVPVRPAPQTATQARGFVIGEPLVWKSAMASMQSGGLDLPPRVGLDNPLRQ